MVLTARGAEQHSHGTDTAQAFINLALALGLPGTPRVRATARSPARATARAAASTARRPTSCPGYRKLDDPAARAHVAGVWGIDPDELPGPGLSAYEMLDRLGTAGGVAGAAGDGLQRRRLGPGREPGHATGSRRWTSSSSPTSSCPRPPRWPTSCCPTAQWAEEEGTMTNLEGRVIRRAPGPAAAGRRADDLAVLERARRPARSRRVFSADPREVFDELRRASAGGIADYAGISYERIDAEQGVFWPCPTEDHPGTPRLFADRFPTPDGRAQLHPGRATATGRAPDAEYPYVLTTGRVMEQYQSGTQTRRVPQPLAQAQVQPEAELHPDLARRHGIADGDLVELRTRRGRGEFRAHAHRRHPPGHRVRAVPLGRRVGRERADQPGARPAIADAGVQGLRRPRRPTVARAPTTPTPAHPTRADQPLRRPSEGPDA